MEYFIAYDIKDNGLRTKLASILKDAGLERVQYSVFFGSLSSTEKKELRFQCVSLISGFDADIYFIPVCSSCLKKSENIMERAEETDPVPEKATEMHEERILFV